MFRPPFLDPDDAVVVVTGASSGIGRLTARRLARRGATVVLAARDEGALAAVVAECRERGGDAVAVPTDVSQLEAVRALARTAEAHFGRIDAWVNVAGVMAYGRFDEVPVESHRQVLATNLDGVLYGSHEAMVRFHRQGHGLLVNVASLLGEMTTPYVSSYSASKSGVLSLTRGLRRDVRRDVGIEICCVLPSSMDTPIFRAAANHHGRRGRAIPPVADPDRVARAIERCFDQPRAEVRVGLLGRAAAMGSMLVPSVYDRIVGPAYHAAAFTGEEAEPTDGNLFETSPEWHDVRGGWRNRPARAAAAGSALVAVLAAAVARRWGQDPPGDD